MENEKSPPPPPPLPPPPGGGGGGPPDKHSSSNGKTHSDDAVSGRKMRRRPPRLGAAGNDVGDDEEESKVEIESLAAASGFGIAGASSTQNNNDQTTTAGTAVARNASASMRQNLKPGAYAVDGPDHGSHDSLLRLVGGVNPETNSSSNNNSNNSRGNGEAVGLSIDDENDRGGNINDADTHGGDGHTIISSSAQSGQSGQSENSAVAEVRAALDAEREAARAAGIGTRRPSMRSSMISSTRSSMTSGDIGSSGVGERLGGATSASASAGGDGITRSITGSRSVDFPLANHPDIEFLAEATLVVDSANGDDQQYSKGDDEEEELGAPPDFEVALNDADDGTMASEDVSTIGPPPELSSLASGSRPPTRVRSSSNGSSRSRIANNSASGSIGGSLQRGRRQRRSDRPTDPYADLPEASCTSIDESTTFNRSRTPSREMPSSLVEEFVDEEFGPETSTNGHAGIEEGSSASPAESSVLVAEPLKDKCLLPRRTVVTGLVVGFALVLAVALGVAIPLAIKDDASSADGGSSYPVYDFDMADDEVLTTVPEPICLSLLPIMSNVSKVCTNPVVDLPKGGPMCQLIADGLLGGSDPAAKIDVVLVNAGGFRADILPGDLTVGYIQKQVMPFNNNRVAYLSVTPAEIYDTLNAALFDTGIVITEEQQRRNGENPTIKLTWPFESTYPYAGGLRYDVDLNAPEGQKATNVRIRSKTLSNEAVASIEESMTNDTEKSAGDVEDGWLLLDPSDDSTLIRVLSSDFLAGGGDGYFQTVPEERVEIDNALEFNDVFMYYCTLQSELVGPHYIDGMSTRKFVPLEGYENDL